MLTQSRQDAANMLEEARQQQEAWQREAYDEGYQHGVQAAQAETTGQLQQAGNLLAEAQQARHTLLGDVEPEVIRLVLAIAKKVIRREIALDQSIVVETVRNPCAGWVVGRSPGCGSTLPSRSPERSLA